MSRLFEGSLLWPAVVLGILAWLVPRIYGWILPEGVRPLMFNGFMSTLTLFALSGGFFLWLYTSEGATLETLLGQGLLANVLYFGRLGLSAAIIWAPIMLLSLSGLPRKWKTEVW